MATRLLVVDDLEAHLYLAKKLFESVGYEVVLVTTKAEAWNRLLSDERFDAILSDIGMPTESGWDLIEQVKKDPRFKSIPFIFITATHRTDEVKARALALGAIKFLMRPMEPQAVLDEVEAALPAEKRMSTQSSPQN